jgi:hypothetical protein
MLPLRGLGMCDVLTFYCDVAPTGLNARAELQRTLALVQAKKINRIVSDPAYLFRKS